MIVCFHRYEKEMDEVGNGLFCKLSATICYGRKLKLKVWKTRLEVQYCILGLLLFRKQ